MSIDALAPEEARQEVLEANRVANEAIAKLRPEIWRELRWMPHAVQQDILTSTSRNKVFAGGRRVGKSQTGGQKLVPYAFSALAERDWLEDNQKRREYWIVGPEYSDAEKEFRVVWNSLRRLGVDFDAPGSYNNVLTGEMHISLWGGIFQVHAKSAKYPNTLVGEGVSGIVVSEAAKLKPTVWPKMLRPTLADFVGWAYFGSTPEGRNWFYRLWEAGQDPLKADWASWRAASWTNRHLFPMGATDEGVKALRKLMKSAHIPLKYPLGAYFDHTAALTPKMYEEVVDRTWATVGAVMGIDSEVVSMMLDLSEELFNQEIAALFNEFVGRVFKEFDEEIHVGDFGYEPGWKTYAALDYGFTNPFVWLLVQIDPHGERIRIIDEYFEVGRTTREATEEIQARGLAPGSLLAFAPDPAEPDRSKEISGLLKIKQLGGTGGPIADRLEWIRRKLKPDAKVAHLGVEHDEWVPQLQIARRCKQTIREWNAYRYPSTYEEALAKDREAPEVPMKKDDHTPEALGRLLISLYGSPWATIAPARVSRARVGRGRR
jgi:hypothetical protein